MLCWFSFVGGFGGLRCGDSFVLSFWRCCFCLFVIAVVGCFVNSVVFDFIFGGLNICVGVAVCVIVMCVVWFEICVLLFVAFRWFWRVVRRGLVVWGFAV